jgi:Flp pilus assembly protein TadG
VNRQPRSYFSWLRRERTGNKSQSLVEFTMVLPIFLTLMCGVFDYGLMVYNANVLAMASREAANSAFRVSTSSITAGLIAAVDCGAPRVDFTGTYGGVVITQVQYTPSNTVSTNYVWVVSPITNNVASTGSIYGGGDNLKNQTHLNSGTSLWTSTIKWQSPTRALPFAASNLAPNQTMFIVECFYSNNFVTPIGTLIGLVTAPVLYDSAYF